MKAKLFNKIYRLPLALTLALTFTMSAVAIAEGLHTDAYTRGYLEGYYKGDIKLRLSELDKKNKAGKPKDWKFSNVEVLPTILKPGKSGESELRTLPVKKNYDFQENPKKCIDQQEDELFNALVKPVKTRSDSKNEKEKTEEEKARDRTLDAKLAPFEFLRNRLYPGKVLEVRDLLANLKITKLELHLLQDPSNASSTLPTPRVSIHEEKHPKRFLGITYGKQVESVLTLSPTFQPSNSEQEQVCKTVPAQEIQTEIENYALALLTGTVSKIMDLEMKKAHQALQAQRPEDNKDRKITDNQLSKPIITDKKLDSESGDPTGTGANPAEVD